MSQSFQEAALTLHRPAVSESDSNGSAIRGSSLSEVLIVLPRMSDVSFREYYDDRKRYVDEALTQAICFPDWPSELAESVRYSLMAGGKRLRPILVMMAGEVCGGAIEQVIPACIAVEMVHTYSLIHDDLPSMDDDDLRRGRPTNHIVYGESTAILAGDALLTAAFETLTDGRISPAAALECVRILAGAAGGSGMVGGQILDLQAEKKMGVSGIGAANDEAGALSIEGRSCTMEESSNLTSTGSAVRVEELVKIHRMKTGALITASLKMGAVVASAGQNQLAALQEFGDCVGLAFQIADDLLDVTGNHQKLGKETGRDMELGKLTYPSLLGIEGSRQKARSLIEQACQSLEIFGSSALRLRQLAEFIVERDH